MKKLILALFVMVGGFLLLGSLDYSKAAEKEQPKFLTRLTSATPFDFQWSRAPVRNKRIRFNSRILAQNDSEWIMIYYGNDDENPKFIAKTSSGGYLVGGETDSFTTYDELTMIFLLELTSTGSIKQQIGYSGYQGLYVKGFDKTRDGKYVLTGSVQQIDPFELSEMYLLKLSPPNYVIESQALIGDLGGSSGDTGHSVQQVKDGKYLVAGLTGLGGNFIEKDLWLLKCSQNFNIESQQTYGGRDFESDWLYATRESSIIQLSDGRHILAGDTQSYGAGGADIWILEFDQNMNLKSQQTIGGVEDDYLGRGPCVQETEDGGIIVAGTTESYGAGGADIWILEFDQNMNLKSQQTIGGEYIEKVQCVQPTDDGGFIVAGGSRSFNSNQSTDAFYFKLSSTLNVEWEYTFGGEGYEEAQYAVQTNDGKYAITGPIQTQSGVNDLDIFVLMVSANGDIPPGNKWIRSANALVTDTSVIASKTNTRQKNTAGISSGSNLFSTATDFTSKVLHWNLNQPPINLSLEVAKNKSYFVSELWHTLTWSPNPHNSKFTIVNYKIYRKEANDDGPYQEIGTVSGNIHVFVDTEVKENKEYRYVVTSIDSDGNESPQSEPIKSWE